MSDELTPTPEAPVAEGGSKADAPETYTKEQMTKAVHERFERERTNLIHRLGVDSLDDLKSIVEEYRQIKASDMSEVEKATAQAQEEARRAAELEAQLKSIEAKDKQRALLADMGFDTKAVEKLAGRLLGDDEEAWKADAADYLALLPKGKTPPPDAANHLETPPESDEQKALAAIRKGAGLA